MIDYLVPQTEQAISLLSDLPRVVSLKKTEFVVRVHCQGQ